MKLKVGERSDIFRFVYVYFLQLSCIFHELLVGCSSFELILAFALGPRFLQRERG